MRPFQGGVVTVSRRGDQGTETEMPKALRGWDGKYIMLGLTIVAVAFSLIKVSSHPDDCTVFF